MGNGSSSSRRASTTNNTSSSNQNRARATSTTTSPATTTAGGPSNVPPHLLRQQNPEFQRQYQAQQQAALQQLQRMMFAMTQNGSGNNRRGPAVEAVTEGRTISNECAVNTHTMKLDKENSTITFDVVNNVPCEVEVHVAVRLDVYQGIVFATPNRQRAPPRREVLETPNKEGKQLTFRLDEMYATIPERERTYSMHAAKQFPLVISVLYQHEVDKDGKDKKRSDSPQARTPPGNESLGDGRSRSPGGTVYNNKSLTPHEQLKALQETKKSFNAEEAHKKIFARRAEHTCLQMDPHLKVVRQFFELEGGTYLVEHLYGGEHEARVVAETASDGVDGQAETGAVMTGDAAAALIDADGDDDDTCVICLTEERNTCVMPCRHLCLCKECANQLRMHSPKCPVCRGPISQLLSMKKRD